MTDSLFVDKLSRNLFVGVNRPSERALGNVLVLLYRYSYPKDQGHTAYPLPAPRASPRSVKPHPRSSFEFRLTCPH